MSLGAAAAAELAAQPLPRVEGSLETVKSLPERSETSSSLLNPPPSLQVQGSLCSIESNCSQRSPLPTLPEMHERHDEHELLERHLSGRSSSGQTLSLPQWR